MFHNTHQQRSPNGHLLPDVTEISDLIMSYKPY